MANLNNDIVGNSCGSDGVCDDAHVRVFSEGPRWQGDEELAAAPAQPRRRERFARRATCRASLDGLADDLSLGLDVRQIWRNDRFGRGGDHSEFLNAGFPAVRFTVAIENYNWQHQDLRTENGIVYGDTIDRMDFPYLRKVTQLNVAALAALARAPPPPAPVVEGAVSTDTTMTWEPASLAPTPMSFAGGAPTPPIGSDSLRVDSPVEPVQRTGPSGARADEPAVRPLPRRARGRPGRRLGVRRLLASRRTATKARSHPRCRAARSGPTRRHRRRRAVGQMARRTANARPSEPRADPRLHRSRRDQPAGKREIARAFGLDGARQDRAQGAAQATWPTKG